MKLEYIKVGRVVNAHGIRGDLRVQPMGQSPDFLTHFKTLYLDGTPVKPESCRVHKSLVLVKLPGIDDMDAALAMKGKVISIRRADAHLPKGAFFDDELVGLQVEDADSGEALGELKEVLPYPAHNVYRVVGQREYLIPAVKDVFIAWVDLDENRMGVHMLEGLATDEN